MKRISLIIATALLLPIMAISQIDTTSYSIGMSLGARLSAEGAKGIDYISLIQGLRDQMNGKTIIDKNSSDRINYEYFTSIKNKMTDTAKQEGEDFLAKNAERAEIITTASGLQYEIIRQGTGENPTADNEVTVHYVGKLLNGEQFDSSIERGEPASFPLGRVIKGWTEGLQLMNVGSKYRFYIPQDLAYGARGAGGVIPPYATLIFEVELLSYK